MAVFLTFSKSCVTIIHGESLPISNITSNKEGAFSVAERQRRDKGDGCISQRKDGTWTSRIKVGLTPEGKPKIKAFYGKTEAEVKRKLKEFQKELHKNDGAVAQRNTVANYMLDWLRNVKANELKPKSYDKLEQAINNQIILHIGYLQLAALTSDDVQKMINDLIAEGLGYSTIKKAYDATNECFKTGIIKKSVVHNPALEVTIPAKKSFPKPALRTFSVKRLRLAIKAINGTAKKESTDWAVQSFWGQYRA